MNKNFYFPIVLLISMLSVENLAFCKNSIPVKTLIDKQVFNKINYELNEYAKTEDGSSQWSNYFIEGDNKKWEVDSDVKLPAFSAYLNIKKMAKNFAEESAQKIDSKWKKIIINRPNKTVIECFAKEDAVIHVVCPAKNRLSNREAEYIYIADPEMVNNFVGDKIFGLDSKEFFKKYGYVDEYTSQGTDFGYLSYSFSLVDDEKKETINIHFKDNKVCGISYDFLSDFNIENYSKDFKCFVSPKIADGLYTKGICLKNRVELKEDPLKTKIITRIDKDTDVYIIDFKEIDGKGTWVKLISYDGFEGWVEGKNITPSAHCFSESSRLNATLDYLFDVKLHLSTKKPLEMKIEKANVLNFMKIKIYDGVEISELFSSMNDETDEVEVNNEDKEDKETEEVKEVEENKVDKINIDNKKEIKEIEANKIDVDSRDDKEEYADADDETDEDEEEDTDTDDSDVDDEDDDEDDNDDADDDEEEGEFVKMLITKPVVSIAGFKVGCSVEDLKNFSNKLSLAGWFKLDNNEIKNDGIYTWAKKEEGCFIKSINIKVLDGKVFSLEFVNLEMEY